MVDPLKVLPMSSMQAPSLNKELKKIMEAEVQDEKDGLEQTDTAAMFQADGGPGELQQFQFGSRR